jgi:hypothetical protein
MIISKLPKMIPEFIFQIKPSPWGNAIGEGFKPIGGFVGGTAKGGVRYGANRMGNTMEKSWGQELDQNGNSVDSTTGWGGFFNKAGKAVQHFTSKNH